MPTERTREELENSMGVAADRSSGAFRFFRGEGVPDNIAGQNAIEFESILRTPKSQRTPEQVRKLAGFVLDLKRKGTFEEAKQYVAPIVSLAPSSSGSMPVTPASPAAPARSQPLIPADTGFKQIDTSVEPAKAESTGTLEPAVPVLGHGSRISMPGTTLSSFPGAIATFEDPAARLPAWKEEAYKTLKEGYAGDLNKLREEIKAGRKPVPLEGPAGVRQQELYGTVQNIENAGTPEELDENLGFLVSQGNTLAKRLIPKVAKKMWSTSYEMPEYPAEKDTSVFGQGPLPIGTPQADSTTAMFFPNLTARRLSGQGKFSQGVGVLWDVLDMAPRAAIAALQGASTRDDLTFQQRFGRPDAYSTDAERFFDFTAGSALSGSPVKTLASSVPVLPRLAKGGAALLGRSKMVDRASKASPFIGDLASRILPTESAGRAATLFGDASKVRFADEGVSLFPGATRPTTGASMLPPTYGVGSDLTTGAIKAIPDALAYGAVPTAFLASESNIVNPNAASEAVTSAALGTLFPMALGGATSAIKGRAARLLNKAPEQNLTRYGEELMGPAATFKRMDEALQYFPPMGTEGDVELFQKVIRPALNEARKGATKQYDDALLGLAERSQGGPRVLGPRRELSEIYDNMFQSSPGTVNPVARGKGADNEYSRLMRRLQETESSVPNLVALRNDVMNYITERGGHIKVPKPGSEMDGARQFLDNLQREMSGTLDRVAQDAAENMSFMAQVTALESGHRGNAAAMFDVVGETEAGRAAFKKLADVSLWKKLLGADKAIPDIGREEALFQAIANARLTPLTRGKEFAQHIAQLNEMVDVLNATGVSKRGTLRDVLKDKDIAPDLRKRLEKALKGSTEWEFTDLDYITSSVARGVRDNVRRNVANRTNSEEFSRIYDDASTRAIAGNVERGLIAAAIASGSSITKAAPRAIVGGAAGPSSQFSPGLFEAGDEMTNEMSLFGGNN